MASRLEARVAQHDREIAAIRKLVLTGMRMLVRRDQQLERLERTVDRIAGELEATQQDLRALAASQRETDRVLRGLMRSLERGGNGHSRRNVR